MARVMPASDGTCQLYHVAPSEMVYLYKGGPKAPAIDYRTSLADYANPRKKQPIRLSELENPSARVWWRHSGSNPGEVLIETAAAESLLAEPEFERHIDVIGPLQVRFWPDDQREVVHLQSRHIVYYDGLPTSRGVDPRTRVELVHSEDLGPCGAAIDVRNLSFTRSGMHLWTTPDADVLDIAAAVPGLSVRRYDGILLPRDAQRLAELPDVVI